MNMGLEQLSYSGIITKVRAMKSSLLEDDDFEKIINSNSVSDIILFLKEHEGYKNIFRELDSNTHRGEIEHELIRSLHLIYEKLYRFAKVKHRKGIRIYFYRFEVQVLKICLQNLIRGEIDSTIRFQKSIDLSLFLEFFKKHSEIDLDKLLEATTIDGLLDVLKNTSYYAIINEVKELKEPQLFDYESRLDIFYYEKLWKMKDEVLKGRERIAFTEVIGKEIDLLNLVWIYRFKTYFNTDSGKIMNSIIPVQYKLTKKLVSDMVATENSNELNELIMKSYYRILFKTNEIKKEDLERYQRQYVNKIYRECALKNSYSIIPILFFFHLKERELDKLTTALECVRYRLSVEKSLKILENF